MKPSFEDFLGTDVIRAGQHALERHTDRYGDPTLHAGRATKLRALILEFSGVNRGAPLTPMVEASLKMCCLAVALIDSREPKAVVAEGITELAILGRTLGVIENHNQAAEEERKRAADAFLAEQEQEKRQKEAAAAERTVAMERAVAETSARLAAETEAQRKERAGQPPVAAAPEPEAEIRRPVVPVIPAPEPEKRAGEPTGRPMFKDSVADDVVGFPAVVSPERAEEPHNGSDMLYRRKMRGRG